MLPSNARKYLLAALAASPDVYDRLLKDVPAEDTVWDVRPDPDRFTIREAVAHMADWEEVFLDRLTRTREQDEPTLQGYDEGQFAIDRDYAHQGARPNLTRFREGREKIVAFFHSLQPEEWERIGHHTEVGPISLEAHGVLILGHDGYHAQQVVQWLAAGGR